VTIRPQAGGLPVPDGYRAVMFPIHVSDGGIMEMTIFVKGA